MAETSKSARYYRGLDRIREVGGSRSSAALIDSLADVAPDLADFVVSFVYGEIFTQPGLSTREQELVTLSALTAQGGCEAQIKLHVGCALRAGITPEVIIATIIHCAAYAGFPRSLNAVFAAREVFADQDLLPVDSSKKPK